MDRHGHLKPGPDYVIGAEFQGEPIMLYFTPTPGHYEAVLPPNLQDASLDDDLQALLEQAAQCPRCPLQDLRSPHFKIDGESENSTEGVSPHKLAWVHLRLEQDTSFIEEVYARLHGANGGDWDMRQVITEEIKELIDRHMTRLSQMGRLVSILGAPYLETALCRPDAPLHASIISPLLLSVEAIGLQQHRTQMNLPGPLSLLYKRVLACLPSQAAPPVFATFVPLLVPRSEVPRGQERTAPLANTHKSLLESDDARYVRSSRKSGHCVCVCERERERERDEWM